MREYKKPVAKSAAVLLKNLQAIEELNCVLENWCSDDGKAPEDYTLDELRDLAVRRRAEFDEEGHTLYEAKIGERGPEEKAYAKSQQAKVSKWIAAVVLAIHRAKQAT